MYKKSKVLVTFVTISAMLLLGVLACGHTPDMEAELTIIEVSYLGGFAVYSSHQLCTK